MWCCEKLAHRLVGVFGDGLGRRDAFDGVCAECVGVGGVSVLAWVV